MNETDIEWCFGADGRCGGGYTWNLFRGCSKDDVDCDHCYAMRIAARFSHPGGAFEGFAKMGPKGPRWTGKLAMLEDKLTEPMRCRDDGAWIFANSTSDPFHKNVPDEDLDWFVASMMLSTHMKHVVLTKRPHRMADYFHGSNLQARWHRCAEDLRKRVKGRGFSGASVTPPDQLPPHIWWGMSAGNQETFDKRIDGLLSMPSGRHLLSLEPLIGEIDARRALENRRVEWVIAGAESGPGRRPAREAWARTIRDACASSAWPVSFFLKQWALADVVAEASQYPQPGIAPSQPYQGKNAMLSVPFLDGVQYNQPPRTFATDGVN